MPKLPQPVVYKTSFQARYTSTLEFFDLFMPAAMLLTEYKDWETDRNFVRLKDTNHRCSVSITHNAITYNQDSNDMVIAEERLQHCCSVLPEALKIKEFSFLGYRRQHLIVASMNYENLVDVVRVKFLSGHERLQGLLPPKVNDLLYRVDVADEKYSYMITVAPVFKQQLPQLLEFDRSILNPATAEADYVTLVKAYPDVSVFIDIDIRNTDRQIAVKDVGLFVIDARNRMDTLIRDLNDYLFGKTEGA